jgi:hypothetical protein
MAPVIRQNTAQIGMTIPSKFVARLDYVAKLNQMPRSRLVTKILGEYLDKIDFNNPAVSFTSQKASETDETVGSNFDPNATTQKVAAEDNNVQNAPISG